jgi:hypothetical protein
MTLNPSRLREPQMPRPTLSHRLAAARVSLSALADIQDCRLNGGYRSVIRRKA